MARVLFKRIALALCRGHVEVGRPWEEAVALEEEPGSEASAHQPLLEPGADSAQASVGCVFVTRRVEEGV